MLSMLRSQVLPKESFEGEAIDSPASECLWSAGVVSEAKDGYLWLFLRMICGVDLSSSFEKYDQIVMILRKVN